MVRVQLEPGRERVERARHVLLRLEQCREPERTADVRGLEGQELAEQGVGLGRARLFHGLERALVHPLGIDRLAARRFHPGVGRGARGEGPQGKAGIRLARKRVRLQAFRAEEFVDGVLATTAAAVTGPAHSLLTCSNCWVGTAPES